jgi:hypothetical protein
MCNFQKIALLNNSWVGKKHEAYALYASGWAEYRGEVLTATMIINIIISEYLTNDNEVADLPNLLNGKFSIILSDKKNTYLIE